MTKQQSKLQQLPEQPIEINSLEEFRKKYQHDAFCKRKLKNLQMAKKFLKHVLKPEVRKLVDIERLEIDPDSYIDKRLRRYYLDILYRIPLKDSEEQIMIFVLIELKTNSDKWTIFQVAEYIIRIWSGELAKAKKEKRLGTFLFPTVIPIVFNHGEKPFTAPLELIKLVRVIEGLESCVLNMKALLFDVPLLNSKDFPKDISLSVLFMTLQSVFKEDVAQRLMDIYRKLEPTFHLKATQEEWAEAIFYATTSAKHFSSQDADNINNQIEKEGVSKMTVSALDQLVAQGEEKGKTEFGRKAVLNFLCRKFKLKDAPKKIKSAIQRMNDPIALESLLYNAWDCQTLDEFAKELD
jgi:predicted transposase/invertase (TIGR01784 family)